MTYGKKKEESKRKTIIHISMVLINSKIQTPHKVGNVSIPYKELNTITK